MGIIGFPALFQKQNYYNIILTVMAIAWRQLHSYDFIRKTLIFLFFSPGGYVSPLHLIHDTPVENHWRKQGIE